MALRLTVLPTSTRSGHGPGRFGKDELGSRQIRMMGGLAEPTVLPG